MKMIIEILILVLALMAGGLLGVIFFGGLWWTIKKGVDSKRPALLFVGSMLLRTSVTLAGFYFIGHDNLERVLVCLVGFVLARIAITKITKKTEKPSFMVKEARHEPYSR
jgi:F1F0 ATPase subunit 2